METRCNNQPFLLLMQLSKTIQDRIKVEIAQYKLNITEFSVLEVLYHKEKQTIHQICDSILITSGSMTYVIDKLEQKGLLMRVACPTDRRVIHVILTDEGKNLINKIMPEHQELVNYMFGGLTDTEAETMVHLLTKVKQRVDT